MKIGVAIIACDRLEYTLQCANSVFRNKGNLDEIIIVNDGRDMAKGLTNDIEWIDNKPPYQSVGVTKNRAMKELLNRGCDHLFIIENDIIVESDKVWNVYIDTAKQTGIEHLNFGYHGPANRNPHDYSKVAPRAVIEYGKDVKVALNPNSVGAFSYFTKKFIEKVGYHDVFFKNAWEHVELCQRAISMGHLPGFWWFPDVAGSEHLLKEIEGAIQNSSITHTTEWTDNMRKGAEYYKKLHGWVPTQTPDTPIDTIKARLKKLYNEKASS